ncbi:MAG: LptF/LptG family permease [Bacteroidia bacterium]
MNRLFIRNFTGPWFAVLGIALFILVTKSLGYILDDLAGSGSAMLIAEVAFWTGGMVLPGAISIAGMAAAIMTMGGLKERHELYAFYAAGISPFRVSMPAIIASVLVFGLSCFATQHLTPTSYKYLTGAVWEAKAGSENGEIHIRPGRFIQQIEQVTIYTSDDHPEDELLHDFLIYDYQNKRNSFPLVLLAEHGSIRAVGDMLSLRLFNGTKHEPDSAGTYSRTYFDSLRVNFQLPGPVTVPKVPDGHRYFLTNENLLHLRDSLRRHMDTLIKEGKPPEGMKYHQKKLAKVEYESYRRWSMPANALVFLLLGWLLGLRIGKGGLAIAGLVALALTIVGALLLEQGKMLASELILSPFMGAFLTAIGLVVIGVFIELFYQIRQRQQ